MFSNVEVRRIDDRVGRGLFAKSALTEGSVIFQEWPIVCGQYEWNRFYNYRACDHCLKPLERVFEVVGRLLAASTNALLASSFDPAELPHPELDGVNQAEFEKCPSCGVVYCSTGCRQEAASLYHDVLCTAGQDNHPVNVCTEYWRSVHFPPETFSLTLVLRLLAMCMSCSRHNREYVLLETGEKCNSFSEFLLGNFCSNLTDFDGVITAKLLRGDAFREQVQQLQELCQFLHHESTDNFLADFNSFARLLTLVARNGQGIGTNSLARWAHAVLKDNNDGADDAPSAVSNTVDRLYEILETEHGSFLDCEGTGLYQVQSMINHSCRPNVQVDFTRTHCSRLSLVALKDIAVGDELTISYLNDCQLESGRVERRSELHSFYLFDCSCSRCCSASPSDNEDFSSDESDH